MPGTPRKTAAKAAPRKAAPRKATAAPKGPLDDFNPYNPPGTGAYTLGAAGGEALQDLTMPSGQTCQVRRPGIQGLIGAGILDSFDQLTALVQTEHIDKKATANQGRVSKEQVATAGEVLAQDPKKMQIGFQTIDKMVCYIVTQPVLWMDYQLMDESDEDWERRRLRESARRPVRNVLMGDKLFLVQWAVGGSADLAAFREGLGADLDALESIQGILG